MPRGFRDRNYLPFQTFLLDPYYINSIEVTSYKIKLAEKPGLTGYDELKLMINGLCDNTENFAERMKSHRPLPTGGVSFWADDQVQQLQLLKGALDTHQALQFDKLEQSKTNMVQARRRQYNKCLRP